ncbi:MAG: hypothetical protein IKT55_05385 [Clostridia bacterium]|nr:hypothetical protein [Clostridia bacterium]
MKKIFALCSLIICVSLVLTVFVSCGKGEKNDPTDANESNVVSVTNGEFVFNAEVGAESTVIKNNGEEYQTLNYPTNAGYPFDLAYAQSHAEFKDMNFDGQPDFYIAVSVNGETIYYYCWLFNATTKKFDFSVSLSGLTNISVDSDNQVIYSTNTASGEVKIVAYVWANGQLTLKEVYDNEDDTIPPEVTEAAQQNAIGTVTKPAKTTSTPAEKTTKADKNNSSSDGSTTTTKQNKPLNTTTTAPGRDGIEVLTGNINDGWY